MESSGICGIPLYSCAVFTLCRNPAVPALMPIISHMPVHCQVSATVRQESEVIGKHMAEMKLGFLPEECMEFRHMAQCGEKTFQSLQQLDQRSRDREVHLYKGPENRSFLGEQILKRQQVWLWYDSVVYDLRTWTQITALIFGKLFYLSHA